jgi:hypothetical protein
VCVGTFLSLAPWVAITSLLSLLSNFVNLEAKKIAADKVYQQRQQKREESGSDQEYKDLAPEPRDNGQTFAGWVMIDLPSHKETVGKENRGNSSKTFCVPIMQGRSTNYWSCIVVCGDGPGMG